MSKIKYPPGCKDIHVEISSEELCRRLKVAYYIQINQPDDSTNPPGIN